MYTPAEYGKILQMSSKKRILVEGRDDYYLILALFEEFFGSEWGDVYGIEVDKAENFISATGNRQAIENVVSLVSNTNLRDNFVGLVDREFRDFSWKKGELIDQIKKHFVDGRILWTRGHSAENYFLDEKILKIPFRDVSGEVFQKAYDMFRKNLGSYLRIACKLSLTALNLNYLKRIRASLGWDIIGDNAKLDVVQWKMQLSKIGFDTYDIESITGTYLEIGPVIDSADIETVRWFCDGHLSFFFLWCAFAKCAYIVSEHATDKRKMAQSILRYGDETRFNSCASAWAKYSQTNSCEYPKEIFVMLNLNERNESIS